MSLTACTDGVGSCDDPRKGQDTVLVGGVVQYGGQAILNTACATGCHASTARGSARNGAPAGLDFDLRPLAQEELLVRVAEDGGMPSDSPNGGGVTGLRARQRAVFEHRELIWQQVRDELMPPDGKFSAFRVLRAILQTPEDTPCAAYARLAPTTSKSSMDIVRNWLACGAPIVEAVGAPDDEGPSYGTVLQYPSCGEPDPGDAGVVTLEMVQAQVFEPACVFCHPAPYPQVSLTSVAESYESLVEDTSEQCNGKPYVMAGDPAQSFLYEIVSEEDPSCSQRMPQGGILSRSQIELIRRWIAGGALRESDLPKARAPLSGGLDAGL